MEKRRRSDTSLSAEQIEPSRMRFFDRAESDLHLVVVVIAVTLSHVTALPSHETFFKRFVTRTSDREEQTLLHCVAPERSVILLLAPVNDTDRRLTQT